MESYLTPAAISYVAQFILALAITVYLGYRLRWAARTAYLTRSLWLAGFFVSITLFSLLLLGESSLLRGQDLYALYAQNTILALGLVCLIQFAYSFTSPAAFKREARLALVLSLAYAAWELLVALQRYQLLANGQVLWRVNYADYPVAIGMLWVPVVLARQAVRAADPPAAPDPTGLRRLVLPQGHVARAARALALVYLLPLGLCALTLLKTFHAIPADLYRLSLSTGILIALAAFAVAYLNHLPETTSFMVKLSGLTLTALLAVLGAVGWVITPLYAAHYQPVLLDRQTLRFTPNAGGGYDIQTVPFYFENKLGVNLDLVDNPAATGKKSSAPVDFDFVFYGQRYAQVCVAHDGAIAMGRAVAYRDYVYHYGGPTPHIFPLLVDLLPEAGGGVFARQEPGRLILTWDHIPAFSQRQAVFTFQAVLQQDGVFDLTYNGLPERVDYYANSDPWASVWLIGSTPGQLAQWPQFMQVSQLAQGQAITGGPRGLVQDYYLDFRRHLHELLLPLAGLLGAASLLVLAGFPFLFYLTLVQPLNALVAGVRQMNLGRFDVTVTPQFQDEIGFLTESFNTMGITLNDLLTNLETRVAERTAKLEALTARITFLYAQANREAEGRKLIQAQLIERDQVLGVINVTVGKLAFVGQACRFKADFAAQVG